MFSLFNFSSNNDLYFYEDFEFLMKTEAYKALLRTGVRKLPIMYNDVFSTLKYPFAMVKTYSYQELIGIKVQNIDWLLKELGEYGAIFSDGLHTYSIYYNDIWPDDLKNWTILSLYAHAELNLVPSKGTIKYGEKLPDSVQTFMNYFVAPDPVLKECGIDNTELISVACSIPLKKALTKSKQMRKSYFSDPTLFDEFITYQFQNFIDYVKP